MNEKLLQECFKIIAETPSSALPKGHSKRFQDRLRRNKRINLRRIIPRIAAVALILIGSVVISKNWDQNDKKEVYAFQKTENYMINVIQTHLDKIEKIDHPSTVKIVSDTKVQIIRMQTDYQQLYSQWESQPTQHQLISALIMNLKKQIDLLTELQDKLIYLETKKQADALL